MPDKSKRTASGTKTKPAAFNPGRWIWVVVGVLAAAALALGYGTLGRTPSSAGARIHEPPLPQSGFTWKYQAYALHTGKPSYLDRGSKITVVMLMASWCLYCAYVDRYVWPSILKTPGLHLDIVDVSGLSGIGDPGPQQPAFSGHDNVGHPINVSGMRSVMSQYIHRFHLDQSNVSVYLEPYSQSYFHVQYFPTILLLNAKGQLVGRVNGGITPKQAQKVIHDIQKSQ